MIAETFIDRFISYTQMLGFLFHRKPTLFHRNYQVFKPKNATGIYYCMIHCGFFYFYKSKR